LIRLTASAYGIRHAEFACCKCWAPSLLIAARLCGRHATPGAQRTNIMQSAVHRVLSAAFLFLERAP
jgi:hypothetical protein